MSIATAPCEWPIIGCGTEDDYGQAVDLGLDCRALDSLSEAARAVIEEAATSHLWNWTGRRFGLCELTLRPCRADCLKGESSYLGASGLRRGLLPSQGAPWAPALFGGAWYNIACGRCGETCSCDRVEQVALPGPVDSVVEVLVDGAALDPTAYRIDNRRLLVRVDGGDWPACNDLGKDPTEPGTWQVSYLRGAPVPSAGQLAAGLLACEMAKALCGDSSCKLPQRVQNISREGVTTVIIDSFEGLEKGQTGIWFVDSWVMSMNNAPRRPKVYSPDLVRPRATTWRATS